MSDKFSISHAALQAIPYDSMLFMHKSYEGEGLDDLGEVEKIFDFIEREAPGTFVLVTTNDSVSPPCASTGDEHYNCDYYDPMWYTVMISTKVWNQHKQEVMKKYQEWIDAHGCKVKGGKQ